ncbi:hypothetical protein GGR51DRAFT_555919 [Nemania sp. FL0031]|nr:hypothetical protein GGR51DRAFT_555919 [Nemania sp. FL0031]
MHRKGHPAKHPHTQSWGPWSEWRWDPNSQRYYAERFDWQGNVEYTWGEGTATTEDLRTPRTDAAIDQLTAGLGEVDINSSGYHDQGVAYPNQSGSAVNLSTPDVPESPTYTHDAFYHGYSHSYRDKGKGIADPNAHDADYNGGLGSTLPTTNTYSQLNYTEQPSQTGGAGDNGSTPTGSFSGEQLRDTSNAYYSQLGTHGGNDGELEQALKVSRDELHIGGPSTSGTHYNSGPIYPGTYDLNPIGLHDGDATPRSTPMPLQSDFVDPSIIRGTPGNVERIDNRFVVEHSYKFQPGEVFKILWSEPQGQVPGGATISDVRAIKDSAGQFYVGYRRFIIVSTDESHHSTCVPILTYDRQGCGKRGVRPSKHGIIYGLGQKPRPLRDEPDLGFEPVPLEIYAEGETLAKESRVNYSKLVTIEHNVKVFFIGRIPPTHFQTVQYAVDKCWNDKMHKSSKKSRR